MQKGPEYFVEAAARVLEKTRHVRFVMAGSGDMMNQMIHLVAKRGIADRFHFTGFLKGPEVHNMHLTAFLFNTGCNIILLLFCATFNNKRIDLSRSSAMNYQGTTYKSFLIMLPVMFFPMMWVFAISWLASLAVALWSLAAMGLIGLILRKPLLNLCVKQFNSRKYIIAQGFREVE